jgi:hypothetical protein
MALHQLKAWAVQAHPFKPSILDLLHLQVASMAASEVKISLSSAMEKKDSSTRRMTLTQNLKVQPLQAPTK